MSVFIVILEDRHIDVKVEVFRTKKDAKVRAAEIVTEYDNYNDRKDRSGWKKPDEWLFFRYLSCEGDCVRVEEMEL
jgi:hypothetical protein